MGRAKQLLLIDGKPLVRHVTEQVLSTPLATVVVVLGADAERIAPALAGLSVHIAVNPAWSDGQGSSLRVGVAAALAQGRDLGALIIALADQPCLPPHHLDRLIVMYRAGGCSIVASQIGPERVAPVLFGARHFERLGTIQGDTGARALVQEFAAETAAVPLPSNADLDTPEDYERFTRQAAADRSTYPT